MPKVSIYLPDGLYRKAQARQLPLSALAQQAVENALRESDRQEWFDVGLLELAERIVLQEVIGADGEPILPGPCAQALCYQA